MAQEGADREPASAPNPPVYRENTGNIDGSGPINWQHPSSVEDYLQGFGRAGRDGKPALAILLTDGGQETSPLKFMARKAAGVSSGSSTAALETRLAEIDQITAVVRRPGCFRRSLLDLLGANPTSRSRLSRRRLERVFTRGARVVKTGFCCDFCDPKEAQNALAVDQTPHARPMS